MCSSSTSSVFLEKGQKEIMAEVKRITLWNGVNSICERSLSLNGSSFRVHPSCFRGGRNSFQMAEIIFGDKTLQTAKRRVLLKQIRTHFSDGVGGMCDCGEQCLATTAPQHHFPTGLCQFYPQGGHLRALGIIHHNHMDAPTWYFSHPNLCHRCAWLMPLRWRRWLYLHWTQVFVSFIYNCRFSLQTRRTIQKVCLR